MLDKRVGAREGEVGWQARLDPFNQFDFGRLMDPDQAAPVGLRLSLQLQNLLDSREIDALAGYTVGVKTPLWFTQAGCSPMADCDRLALDLVVICWKRLRLMSFFRQWLKMRPAVGQASLIGRNGNGRSW